MNKVFHRIYHKVFELISTILLVLTIMMANPVYDMLVILAVDDFHQVVVDYNFLGVMTLNWLSP